MGLVRGYATWRQPDRSPMDPPNLTRRPEIHPSAGSRRSWNLPARDSHDCSRNSLLGSLTGLLPLSVEGAEAEPKQGSECSKEGNGRKDTDKAVACKPEARASIALQSKHRSCYDRGAKKQG